MDSCASMAVRTGMMKAAVQGMMDDALAHDEHLVIITDHMDTCPLCMDWERKVLAIDSEGQKDPECEGLLADAEAAGLFHPNCLHAATPYVSGLTNKEGMKAAKGYTPEQDAAGYANRQTQRYMERNVRKWKRAQAVATTPEQERLCKAYVDRWQKRLREFTGETGLPRQYYREGGRVTLSDEAKKLPKFQFTKTGKGSIINMTNAEYVKGLHKEMLDILSKRLEGKINDIKYGSSLVITDRQFGKKVGRHFKDWGLDVHNEDDRSKFRKITLDVIRDATEIRAVKWDFDDNGERSVEVLAFIKDDDAVLVRNGNEYITTMKGGASNGKVIEGRIIKR